MIKRPLNPQFSSAVLEGRKFTTIREKPWPVGVPIMLYNWSGAAYRSKQIDVCTVVVDGTTEIQITNDPKIGMRYSIYAADQIALWSTEGFDSRVGLDNWFRPLVKSGQTITKHLMRFRRTNT